MVVFFVKHDENTYLQMYRIVPQIKKEGISFWSRMW